MLQKFATQVDANLLAQLRKFAHEDGRQIQFLIGEALKDYVTRRLQGKIRPSLAQYMQQSNSTFANVYKSLSDKH